MLPALITTGHHCLLAGLSPFLACEPRETEIRAILAVCYCVLHFNTETNWKEMFRKNAPMAAMNKSDQVLFRLGLKVFLLLSWT